MKTRTLIIIALVVAALGVTSCKKDDNTKTLKITAKALRSADKAHFPASGFNVMWDDDDELRINNNTSRIDINGNNFTVSVAGIDAINGGYYAAFPSTIRFNGSNGFTCALNELPYSLDELSVPMFAYTNGSNTLNFSTPYAILALNINNQTGVAAGSVEITLDRSNIGGDRTITFDGATPSFVSSEGSTANFSISVSISENADGTLYVPIPGNSEGDRMTITFDNCDPISSRGDAPRFIFRAGYIYNIDLTLE